MQKVKFLQDFQGRETKEVFYKAGQVADLSDELIDQLVKDKRVELVKIIQAPEVKERVEVESIEYLPTSEPELRRDDEIMHTAKSKRGRK